MSGVFRRLLAGCGLSLIVIAGAGCTGGATSPSSAPQQSAPPAPSPDASQTASVTPTHTQTSKNQPVPKVGRSGSSESPTISAKPQSPDGTVKYADGVRLAVKKVAFAKEKDKGPGAFPGRDYALLTLSITNGSAQPMSLDTVVVTVLDKNGVAVSPVYDSHAKVKDFAGTLKVGSTAQARYAFAVAKSSRSKVTVVVDFDGVHTSAVFRGALSS